MYYSLLQTVWYIVWCIRRLRRDGFQEGLFIVFLDALDPLPDRSSGGANDIRDITDFHSANPQFRRDGLSWVLAGFLKDTVLRHLLFLTEPCPDFRMVRRRSGYVSEMPGSGTMPPDCIPIGTREREPLSDVPIHVSPCRPFFRDIPCMDESTDTGTFPSIKVKPPKVGEKETHLIVPASNGGQDAEDSTIDFRHGFPSKEIRFLPYHRTAYT